MILYHKDFRSIGMCSRGQRYFAKQHNIDWCKFLKEGISEEDLLATGDYMAFSHINKVREIKGLPELEECVFYG